MAARVCSNGAWGKARFKAYRKRGKGRAYQQREEERGALVDREI